jgi:hypothetical protein
MKDDGDITRELILLEEFDKEIILKLPEWKENQNIRIKREEFSI